MTRILLIDDDEKLGELLKAYFKRFDMQLDTATLPSAGLARIQRDKPDLVILDVMLPEQDGFEVCRTIRKTSSVPVVMLTARGEVTDRIVGLEIGADDYLPKPFEPRELVARIQNVLRRGRPRSDDKSLRFGDLVINLERRSAELEGEQLDLTTMEYQLLVLFASNPGKTFNRDEILNELRGIDAQLFSRSVDILVSRLRQKLKDTSRQPRFIKTVWGTGYAFIGEEVQPSVIKEISRSLSARLLGIFILTAIVYTVVGRFVYLLVLDQDFLREVVGAHISLHADYVLDDIGSPPSIERAEAITQRVPVDIRISGPGIDWTSDPGFPQIDQIPFGPIPIDFLGLDEKSQRNLESWARNLQLVRFGQYRRHAFVELVRDGYRIIIASPRMSDTPRPDLTQPAIVLISIIVLVGCYFAVRWLVRPIKWIQKGTARIGQGDLDYRIRSTRRDDLGDLAADINHMADDVRDMLEAKRQLLLAISHELRSPLTRAKVALEFLDDGQVKHDLLGDLREMERLIADLLESERMNVGHTTLRRATVELGAMLQSLIHTEFQEHFGQINLKLPSQPVVREVDEVRVRLVAKNLIENALRYTPPDAAPVEVELLAKPGMVVLRVRDHGPGIPREHLARVTEPFYRADPARSRSTGGLGLGLYLAKRIAEAHRGTLVIESELGQGTLCTVTIPDFVTTLAA